MFILICCLLAFVIIADDGRADSNKVRMKEVALMNGRNNVEEE